MLGWTVNWSGLESFIPIASPGFQDAEVRFLKGYGIAKKGGGELFAFGAYQVALQ